MMIKTATAVRCLLNALLLTICANALAGSKPAGILMAELVLNAADYGAVPNDGSDSTLAVRNLLDDARTKGAVKIVFPKGRYDFYETMAVERYTFISNNDEGLKRVAFLLEGIKDLVIDGQGSDFVFHGLMNPFIVSQSSNIRLQNLSIDFKRAFHSEGKILAVNKGSMDLHIPEAFPYKITAAGILRFQGLREYPPGYPINNRLENRKDKLREAEYGYKRALEYDPNTRETPYQVKDLQIGDTLRAEKLPGKRNIRIFHPALKGSVGNILTFSSKYRKYPGFVITDSADVVLDNITIYHAGGMGLLGQRCHNVTVQNSKVTPSEGRIVSATADATHFVNCTGKIQLLDNLFENQQDDATNIHGIYAMVEQRVDDRTLFVKLQHPQQHGFDFIQAGDTLELVHGPSLVTYGTNQVASVERLNKEITKVVFEEDLDKRLAMGDSVAELRDYPEIVIKGNRIHRNRARGMLLNCRGKTLVEDNYFHSPGSALLFEGDATNWYEQGGVRDVTIRNNIFDNAHFTSWGNAVIAVAAGIDDEYRETSRYNRNILIENNTFNVFDKGLILDLFSVKNLKFRNNKIVKTDRYPERKPTEVEFFNVQYSDDVQIDNNQFIGF